MSKDIDTLVPDIYAALEQGVDVDDETTAAFGRTLSALLKDKLSPKKRDSKGKLWFSMIGKPNRQIWYQYHGYKGEEFQGHTLLKFLIGDLWEALLIFLARVSGHTVEGEQKPLNLSGVTGRQDAIIDGVQTDVKSASTYSYKKFKDGSIKRNDPFGYMYQLAGYREAEEVPSDYAAFLAADKQNGHIHLMKMHEIELPNAKKRVAEIKAMVDGPIPERCYAPEAFGKGGNMKLAIGCAYCAFKDECWKDANGGKGIRTFLYSTGPVHLVEVTKVPDVFELTGVRDDRRTTTGTS